MPHMPRLTQRITNARISYLDGQYRRGNINRGRDIEHKIRTNLPAKEEDIRDLRERFLRYILRTRDVRLCDNCDVLTNGLTFYEQNGQILCENCVNDSEEAEEL